MALENAKETAKEMKAEYGLVYKSKPPYEVLYTKWLSYEDVLTLKSVEEMVEVYYNSGQFSYTLKHLVEWFDSPFEMYLQLGKHYEKHALHMMSHSRIARYEILLDFIKEQKKQLIYLRRNISDMFIRTQSSCKMC